MILFCFGEMLQTASPPVEVSWSVSSAAFSRPPSPPPRQFPSRMGWWFQRGGFQVRE